MTAHEIAKMIATEGLTDEESIALYADEIKAYAKRKCEDQRELCGKRCWDTSGVFMKRHTEQVMINTPEPKFD